MLSLAHALCVAGIAGAVVACCLQYLVELCLTEQLSNHEHGCLVASLFCFPRLS